MITSGDSEDAQRAEDAPMMVRAYFAGVPGSIAVVPIINTRGGVVMYLTPEAADRWARMCKAAEATGIMLVANSAWRSYEHQQRLWDAWAARLSKWQRDPRPESEKGRRPPQPASPGRSRHHNAVCVDINRCHDDPDGSGPLLGPTDIWLRENAHKFGFVANVPGELWHFECVGV